MLDKFLEKYIDGYLLKDIETLRTRAEPASAGDYGACGYPLLMAVFSGIELLGALSSSSSFSSGGDAPSRHFMLFWEQMYSPGPERDAGKGVYFLARHGIAHSFAVKGLLTVTKREPQKHLRMEGGECFVDSDRLAADFIVAYGLWKQRNLSGPSRAQAEQRLQEITASNASKVIAHTQFFKGLQPPPAAAPAVGATAQTDSAGRALASTAGGSLGVIHGGSTTSSGPAQGAIPPPPASSKPWGT